MNCVVYMFVLASYLFLMHVVSQLSRNKDVKMFTDSLFIIMSPLTDKHANATVKQNCRFATSYINNVVQLRTHNIKSRQTGSILHTAVADRYIQICPMYNALPGATHGVM